MLTLLADTSIPKPQNYNTDLKSDWLNWIATLGSSGRLANSAITPDQQTKLKAWRPPRQDEIDLYHGQCSISSCDGSNDSVEISTGDCFEGVLD
jgi:hypothetical protein